MMILTVREYARGRVNLPALGFWLAVWSGLLFTGLYPGAYEFVVSLLGLALPINFITTFSIIILFIVTYQIYKRVDDLNRKLTRVAQEIALLRARSEERS